MALIDLRPFVRKMRLGYQTLETIFANFFSLEEVIDHEHNKETGEHETRKVAIASATYRYNPGSNQWLRIGGVGPLPVAATRPSPGEASISFVGEIAESIDDFDIQLSCADSGGDGVIINWANKTTLAIVVRMRSRAEGTGVDEDFSIEIKRAPQ